MAEASGGESSSFAGPSTSDDKGDDVANSESQKEKPTCILCLGMAGSGKTTFVQVHFESLVKSSWSQGANCPDNLSTHVYAEDKFDHLG